MEPLSIYIHIPFCAKRCGYCDFNSYAGLENLIPGYSDALCREIRDSAQSCSEQLRVHTIFFGGGTPSLLSIKELGQILEALHECFDLDPAAEMTLEANPGTVTKDYLCSLRSLGFNRLSLGVQSANPNELQMLERMHDYPTVISTVKWARQAGFDNLNLDLIFGLPGQQLESWQHTMELVLALHPEHLSLYALSIEEDTPFGHWAKHGLIELPDPDLAADMYDWIADILAEKGYAQYEISNWAFDREAAVSMSTHTPLHACQHNLQYWHNSAYLGFGAGAHGYCSGCRTANVLNPAEYIERLSLLFASQPVFPATPATQFLQPIDQETKIGETMLTGLRLVREGVSDQRFQQRFNRSLEEVFAEKIEFFTANGLLEWVENEGDRHLRLTKRGYLLGNQVFIEFI